MYIRLYSLGDVQRLSVSEQVLYHPQKLDAHNSEIGNRGMEPAKDEHKVKSYSMQERRGKW